MDHGSDWRGEDQPPEEGNRIQQGMHYGWVGPFVGGDRQPDAYLPADPENIVNKSFALKKQKLQS